MIKVKLFCAVFAIASLAIQGWLYGDDSDFLEGIDFVMGKGDYSPLVELQGQPERIISNYSKKALDGAYAILGSEDHSAYWKDTYYAVGVVASVDFDAVNLEAFFDAVEYLEELVLLSEEGTVDRAWWLENLEFAYISVGRHGYDVWKPFFDKRLTLDHWNDQLPVRNYKTMNGIPYSLTVFYSMALGATALGEDETEEWLRELIEKNPYLSRSLQAKQLYQNYVGRPGSKMSSKEMNRSAYEADLRIYQNRLQIEKKTQSVDVGANSMIEPSASPHSEPSSLRNQEEGERDPLLWRGIGGLSVLLLVGILVIRRSK